MSIEIRVPQLPESVADATLVAWHKQPGDAVSRDENLADLETDKVVLEVPAPVAGVLQEITRAERHDRDQRPGAGDHRGRRGSRAAPAARGSAGGAEAGAQGRAAPRTARARRRSSRAVRRLVEENRLDPATHSGGGPRRAADQVGCRRLSGRSSLPRRLQRRHARRRPVAARAAAARAPSSACR